MSPPGREAPKACGNQGDLDAGEARWLAERIGKDRLLRDNERALLSFIRETSTSVHPELKPLLDKVA